MFDNNGRFFFVGIASVRLCLRSSMFNLFRSFFKVWEVMEFSGMYLDVHFRMVSR